MGGEHLSEQLLKEVNKKQHHLEAKFPNPPIPDYKVYKVEDAPELIKLQQKLAARGLKDPWIRNYVWQYRKEVYEKPWKIGLSSFGRSFRAAAIITLGCVVAANVYGTYNPEWLKPHDCRKSGCWEHNYEKN